MDVYSQLERDEGNVPYAYQDSEGYWTIGVGFLIDKRRGGGLTSDETQYILRSRVAAKEAVLAASLPWLARFKADEPVRYAVVVNMAYNLGVPGLMKFVQFLSAMQQHNWVRAAQEMEDSDWWRQAGDRAKRLQQQVLTGEWQ